MQFSEGLKGAGVEGQKLVVIEDEEPLRGLIEGAFLREGYQVFSTRDAREAVSLVRRTTPDLILVDSAQGLDVVRDLHLTPETTGIPLVLLTKDGETPRPGVFASIGKPCPLNVLVQRINGIVLLLSRQLEEVSALRPTKIPWEHVVLRDPTSLPEEEGPLPDFAGVPDLLKTVLIVEDNLFFRRFLKEVLVRNGFEVLEAASGDEGLRMALARRPWLIVTDLNMPGLNGFELCRSVRSHSLIRHTPIVFLSGWDEFDQRDQGLDAGANEFLSKRMPVRELLMRIRLILARYAEIGTNRRDRPGMEGRIDTMGATGLLQMCHLTRLTGICRIRSGTQTAEVRFRKGEIVGAERPGLRGAAAVYDLVSWSSGQFDFTRMETVEGNPLGESFDALILEGCRILDEKRRPADVP
jgi:DNA-binding response OmpR family regulator